MASSDVPEFAELMTPLNDYVSLVYLTNLHVDGPLGIQTVLYPLLELHLSSAVTFEARMSSLFPSATL